jgi:hypothetical protein
MSELNCKGSFMLGSACGTCPRCVRNIAEIAKSTPLGARIDKLEAALKEAVEALRFYSSNDKWFGPNYEDGKRLFNKIESEDCSPVTALDLYVGGRKAREALARIEKEIGNG